jgi:hypothetical protein
MDQVGARPDLALDGDRRDPAQVALRAELEERQAAQELDPGVDAEQHEAEL